MAKARSQYVCQQCGYQSPKWLGKCPDCGSWNSFAETVVAATTSPSAAKASANAARLTPQNLSQVKTTKLARTSTKISELDRVLGGGLVPGQVVLLAGEPGIGKSTILLQVAEKLGNVLYVSGEESISQIKIRAQRLGINNKNIMLLDATNVDAIVGTLEQLPTKEQPSLVIVDSIQTMYTGDLSGMAGSVGQVRESASRLIQFAKRSHIPVIIVGQVTKEGSVAGPAALMHLVDTVLWFEGEKTTFSRLIRTVKNRFGPTDEIGIFEMHEAGLKPVENTAVLFVTKQDKPISGSAVACILEGTRPLLVEVQSLVVPTRMPMPRRVAQGVDSRRLELIQAVLSRRAGLNVSEADIFVKIVGGIQIREPGADLAIALSIASAFTDKPLPQTLALVGEVGLLGEIRSVVGENERKKYARRQGFKQIVTSTENASLMRVIRTYLQK